MGCKSKKVLQLKNLVNCTRGLGNIQTFICNIYSTFWEYINKMCPCTISPNFVSQRIFVSLTKLLDILPKRGFVVVTREVEDTICDHVFMQHNLPDKKEIL